MTVCTAEVTYWYVSAVFLEGERMKILARVLLGLGAFLLIAGLLARSPGR